MSTILIALFYHTLIASPLYVLESGLPQPFHVLRLPLILGNAFRPNFRWFGNVLEALVGSAVYAAVVNVLTYMRYLDTHSLLSA